MGHIGVRPLVSVVIPAYNQGPLLVRAIESALAQTYERREIIVVNDGSTDDVTRRTVERFGEAVVYLERPNGGVAAARNTGMLAARGDYIALLDQDDVWRPYKLEAQVRALAANRRVALVHSSYYLVDEHGNRTGTARLPEGRYRPLPRLLLDNYIIPCTVMFDRALAMGAEPFDPSVNGSDDWDLWLRMALDGCNFYCIAEPLAEYRVHAGMTSRDNALMARAGLKVIDKVYARAGLPEPAVRVRGRAYGLRHGWAASVMLAGGDVEAARAHLVQAAKADPAYVTSPPFARVLVNASTTSGVRAGSLLLASLKEAAVGEHWMRRGRRSVRLAQAVAGGRRRPVRKILPMVLREPGLLADRDLWAALIRRVRGRQAVEL